MDTEGGTRYILAGPSGWAAMAKTIRDVDEDKVKDYKEDIDTLLVFTGLFSAVLTAFVIESYQNLSPDPQAAMLQLLGQLVQQTNTYTISADRVTSTVAPMSLDQPPFEPPLAARRVNQLWFASLIVTLITASFAMLVKQWLREYLSVDYTSPHERLRARQFRHPGLASWKVYEIAGLLPLLLQLALGLFFLGICFFTWSINDGIGLTSTVLISAWAFLLVSATLAPLVSPRCPYKTALFKRIMVALRRRIRRRFLPTSLPTGVRVVSHAATVTVGADNKPSTFLPASYFLEEIEAVKRDVDELAILKDVDSFLLDDDLLGTTISESVMQHNAAPPTIIAFVLQVLNNRLGETYTNTQSLTTLPDLRPLTKRGWRAVSDIVGATVIQGLGKPGGTQASTQWLENALYLLFAFSDHQLTPNAQTALVRCIHKDTVSHFMHVVHSLRSEARDLQWIHIMSRLYQLCTTIPTSNAPPEDAVEFIISFLKFALPDDFQEESHSILDLRSVSADSWKTASDTLSSIILAKVKQSSPDTTGTWLEDALRVLMSPSNYPMTELSIDALTHCARGITAPRFGELVSELTFSSHPLTTQFTARLADFLRQLTLRDISAQNVVSFCIHAFAQGRSAHHIKAASNAPPMSHVLDLRDVDEDVWRATTDCVATSLQRRLQDKHAVLDAEELGPWFEDALYLLFSLTGLPTWSPTTDRALIICTAKDERTYLRMAKFLCSLENPMSEHFIFILSRLRRLCDLMLSNQGANSGNIVQFISCSLDHRLQGDPLSDLPPSSVLDLRDVPSDYWHFFTDTVAAALSEELRRPLAVLQGHTFAIPWLKGALSILLSISDCPISPAVCDALLACLQSDATHRAQLLQFIHSQVPTDAGMLSDYVERLSMICRTLSAHPSASPDICSLIYAAISPGTSMSITSVFPSTILDLQKLSLPAWTSLSEMFAEILTKGLDNRGQQPGEPQWTPGPGLWSACAASTLFSISPHALPSKARDVLVTYVQADDIAKTNFWQLIHSKIPSTHADYPVHLMRRICSLCGPLATRSQDPSLVLRLFFQVLSNITPSPLSSPLQSIVDLGSLPRESWNLLTETLCDVVLRPLEGSDQTPGVWMEDAVYIVFSFTKHPFSPGVAAMISRFCSNSYPYKRFGSCLKNITSPTNPQFHHGLSRVRSVLQSFAGSGDAMKDHANVNWLLREIAWSVPCAGQCTHGSNSPSLGPLFHDHASSYPDWTRQYCLILKDCIEGILRPLDRSWPPGSGSSMHALLSCPIPLHEVDIDVADTVLKIMCSKPSVGGVMAPIISIHTHSRFRGEIHMNAAIENVISLVANANPKDRFLFFDAMWDHCDDYTSKGKLAEHPTVVTLNIVRHCALVSQIHAQIEPDGHISRVLRRFYSKNANAMKRFREVKFPELTDRRELRRTYALAAECLATLDRLEPTTEDFEKWASEFKPDSSMFPDDLFQELAAFVTDEGELHSKRVRRLRQSGVERIVAVEAAVTTDSPELDDEHDIKPLDIDATVEEMFATLPQELVQETRKVVSELLKTGIDLDELAEGISELQEGSQPIVSAITNHLRKMATQDAGETAESTTHGVTQSRIEEVDDDEAITQVNVEKEDNEHRREASGEQKSMVEEQETHKSVFVEMQGNDADNLS